MEPARVPMCIRIEYVLFSEIETMSAHMYIVRLVPLV